MPWGMVTVLEIIGKASALLTPSTDKCKIVACVIQNATRCIRQNVTEWVRNDQENVHGKESPPQNTRDPLWLWRGFELTLLANEGKTGVEIFVNAADCMRKKCKSAKRANWKLPYVLLKIQVTAFVTLLLVKLRNAIATEKTAVTPVFCVGN